MIRILLLLLATAMAMSCATRKEVIYFQDIDNLNDTELSQTFEPIIENNDILNITVSSIDKELAAPFQKYLGEQPNNANNNINLQGYLVDSNGNIQFPVLGTVHAAGKTRLQLENEFLQQLRAYVTDAVVDIRIVNFKVTVIGEVALPGVYTIQDERVSLPQALGLAGDMTDDANRQQVVVIREIDGKQQVERIDLTQSSFFNSPFFFLKQNDVVYVEPSLKGVKKSGFIPDIPALLSLFTVILSSVILITNR